MQRVKTANFLWERLRTLDRLRTTMNTVNVTEGSMSMVRLGALLLLLSLVAASCSALPIDSSGGVLLTPTAGSGPLGPTGTPFSPAEPSPLPTDTSEPSPTPTSTPDPAQPWGDFNPPTQSSAIEIPPPAPLVEIGPDVVNILVLGSDARPYGGGYRTDVIMLVSLDPQNGTATLLSIPRDLYVYIPGWQVNRINTAEPHGGLEMMADTIRYTFGLPVQYYARIDFSGFMNAVNTLGGIDVEATGYLYDECGGTWYSYSPGNTYHMDGFTTLCYVRMRHGSSDFDRLRRQQEVLQAIFRQSLTLQALSRFPTLFAQYRSAIETNIGLTDALPLIPLGRVLADDPSAIGLVRIDQSMATGWRVPSSGASVLLPDHAKIQELMQQTFGS